MPNCPTQGQGVGATPSTFMPTAPQNADGENVARGQVQRGLSL